MPNDAKLGLVAGLALVLLIAMTYFRKEPVPVSTAEPPLAPASTPPAQESPLPYSPPAYAPPLARPPMEEDPFAPENAQKGLPLPPLPPPPAPMDENSLPPLPPPTPSSNNLLRSSFHRQGFLSPGT
jgi:hypothetical protein